MKPIIVQIENMYLRIRILIMIVLFCPFNINAQADSLNRGKYEASFSYSIQNPVYSVNTPLDLLLSQDTRYRSRIGLGLNYYLSPKWHCGFVTSFSQEGGGYKKQRTNANYFKNSFLAGYNTPHTRRIIFDAFLGVEMNLLLNARYHSQSNESEKVSDYYHKFNLSYPIGLGVKTKIFEDYYFGCHTFLSFSPYKISKEPYIRVSQFIFPAFQISVSKFLK